MVLKVSHSALKAAVDFLREDPSRVAVWMESLSVRISG
jgi:hypothetical protein